MRYNDIQNPSLRAVEMVHTCPVDNILYYITI